MAEKSGG